MAKKDKFEERKCVVCKKIYYVSKRKARGGKKAAFLRPRTSKTCSKKCSKIYSDPVTRKNYYHKCKQIS